MKNSISRYARVAFSMAGIVLAVASLAWSQAAPQVLQEPQELKEVRGAVRGQDVRAVLEVKYADNQIYNPATLQFDKVHLRSYNGQLAGPTIRLNPGDRLKIDLRNRLPARDPSCLLGRHHNDHNVPNCFNSTNLHFHGFHVFPGGSSDNVLLNIPPQDDFDYVVDLPTDHPAGTFWYHSHRHGSTALQVSSGMVGVLIVEGNRPVRDKGANGIADVDTILKYHDGKPFDEHIMLFEQMQYACGTKVVDGKTVMNWDCTGQVGAIEQYKDGQFGRISWKASGRYTSLNGRVQPTWEGQTGRIQRWRMIHGGVHDTIELKIVKGKGLLNAALFGGQALSIADQETWISKNCDLNQPVSQWEFAVDGLTRKAFQEKTVNIFQPGYRSDVLVFFNQPGSYCVIDEAAPADDNINLEPKGRRLLGMINVKGAVVTEEPIAFLKSQLVSANHDLPAAVRKDLEQLKLTEYVPHQDIPASAVNGPPQFVNFYIGGTPTQFAIGRCEDLKLPECEPQPYNPARTDRKLKLNSTDEWTLTSTVANHPFHIHVNPFQIVEILKPNGQSVIDASGKCTDIENGILDLQYCDQIGVFRDTLFVKEGYRIKIRTHYETFLGEFVLHCHILDHEDQGMMENVTIVPSGGTMLDLER